jgi:hypothetical protein
MLRVMTKAPAAVPTWMVQLEAGFTGPGRPSPDVDELEPMVELLYRTEGVRCAVVAPRLAGLAVALDLSAPDATTAMDRARTLVASCARYAGLGVIKIERVQVMPQPEPAGA